MTILQRRLLFFLGLGLGLLSLLWVLDWSWQGLIILLVLLLVVIGAYIKPLYDLAVHPPARTPEMEEEVPSYERGLQPMVYYTPFDSMPKEELVTDEVPMASYPEMTQTQRQF